MRLRIGILSLVVGLAASAVASWCQFAPSPEAPPVTSAPASPPGEEPIATFKQSVNLVDLYLTVKDKNGELVPHLNQQNCTVLEDNVPQTLKTFEAGTDQPLTLGILLDTSGSQYRWLSLEQDAGSRFIRQVIREKDEAFVASFDVNVDLLQDYTNSPMLLSKALHQAEINSAGGNGGGIPGLGGGTFPVGNPKLSLFYDAIYLIANEKLSREPGRRAMIILTDGDDRGSQKKSGDAISAAVKNNVFVFVVWVGDRDECSDAPDIPHPLRPPAVQLPDVLHDPAWYCNKTMYWWSKCPGYFIARCISEETGGRFIDVGGNRKQLDAAFQKIQEELRTQYWASYTPSNAKTDGTFRRINVDCHGDQGQDLKVRVRKGYYAAQAGIQPKR